jgi:hypothetical protein
VVETNVHFYNRLQFIMGQFSQVHILNATKKIRVKGEYHIQHINSLHSRMKIFFNYNMRGVSTKYLQKYLNWQRIKGLFKDETKWIKTVLTVSSQKADAIKIYNNIENDYLKIV